MFDFSVFYKLSIQLCNNFIMKQVHILRNKWCMGFSKLTRSTSTDNRKKKVKSVWKLSSFLLTPVENTHTHTHTLRGVFYSSLIQTQRFPSGYERSFEESSTSLKLLLYFFWLPTSSSPVSHCATKMVFWAPRCCLSPESRRSPGTPYGRSRTEAKGQRHHWLPTHRMDQK